MNIGVARPSSLELGKVPHFFIASHSIHEKVTAVTFESYALEKVKSLFTGNNVVVMAGGTGMYIQAFCQGMDNIPDVPQQLRNDIISRYNQYGIEWLQNEVQQADPGFYKTGEVQNPHRLIRALEVYQYSGRSILDFRRGSKKQRPFKIIKLALDIPREELYARINNRVDQMMENGLLEEVQSLIPFKHLNALQTVGYKELFDYFDGVHSLSHAISAIKTNTRQYAKRQLTWFRKDKDYRWVKPEDFNSNFKI